MAIEPDTNQTITVPKAEAQPNWAAVGFFALGIITVIIFGWLLFGPLGVNLHKNANLEIKTVEDLRNYFWALGMIVAGTVAVWGLGLAVVRTHALHRQAKVAEIDSKFSEKKHQSEAFATAIEQLGHDNYAVRLGAVYALEALAKSSLDLHGPIFETLCAYVRKEAPAKDVQDLALPEELSDSAEKRQAIAQALEAIAPPDVVVQAILTVIGRRDPERDPPDYRIDLRKTNLRKADMANGNLTRALFHHARLEGANLVEANLREADLSGANLEGAYLYKANLEGAVLTYANLEVAGLLGANLGGAFLDMAKLEGADLGEANLEGTGLSYANLKGAGLGDANLRGADLWRITFDVHTDAYNTDFRGARNIPAQPDYDFRATVENADMAQWPDDDDPVAWDRE